VVVASFGTLELGPVPALPEAVELAADFGLDLSRHRARNVAELNLVTYDLVLGFEQMHVAAAVVEGDTAPERTFTLPELLELLDDVRASLPETGPTERARSRIEAAHAARRPDYPRHAVPEIPDPLGKTWPAQRRTAEELRALVDELARRLFG
jgi:protein-tyrosine-phosphatase